MPKIHAVDTTSGRARDATTIYDSLIQENRVHRSLYTDPQIFADEMVRIFGGTWVYLAHETELPRPDDFVLKNLGLRPIIVSRDSKSEVHALFNRCRHRGATVCREEQGTAKLFACPYHGWTYRNDGSLAGVPGPKAYDKNFEAEHGLARVPRVATYRGFIFGTLNRKAPELLEYLGAARPLIDEWLEGSNNGRVIVRSAAHRMAYRGNWKLAYDNSADGYHPGFSHRSLLALGAQRNLGDSGRDMQYWGSDPDSSRMYLQSLGNGHTFIDQRPAILDNSGSRWSQQRPQPGRENYETQLRQKFGDAETERMLEHAVGSGMNLNIFPNLLLIGNQIQVIEPLAVDRTILTWYATVAEGMPDEINILRMRSQEDFPAFGEPDDQTNFEECQRGLNIPEVEWIDTSRHLSTGREKTDSRGVITGPISDELFIREYYREWKRLMTADIECVAV